MSNNQIIIILLNKILNFYHSKNKIMENKQNDNENNDTNNKNSENKNFLNKKHNHPDTKKHKKKKNNKNKIKINKNKKTPLDSLEKLYQKAKNLYYEKSSPYDLDKLDYTKKINKEKKWTYDILKSSTFDDKISSLMLYIKENPKQTLKYLEMLFRLLNNKNRRKNESVIITLKELFLEYIIQGKKYISFIKTFGNNDKKYKNI